MEKKDLKGIAIYCDTEEEATKCCNVAGRLGWEWRTGETYRNNSWWSTATKNFIGIGHFKYYDFYNGELGCLASCEKRNYKIKDAKWFLDNFATEEDITLFSFVPKDGDICVNSKGDIFISNGKTNAHGSLCFYCALVDLSLLIFGYDKAGISKIYVSLANKGEKKALFDAMAEEGYKWNAEKKKVENLGEDKI